MSRSDETQQTQASELRAQISLLEEENRRLRQYYRRDRKEVSDRVAVSLAGGGGLALVAALLLPTVREVLIVLGATGLFGAALTRLFDEGPLVPVAVGERLYGALDDTHNEVVDSLGLSDARVYVPTVESATPARLYVPVDDNESIPDGDSRDQLFVTDPEHRGVSLPPTSWRLYEEVERTADVDPEDSLSAVLRAVTESAETTFGLAANVKTELDRSDGRVSVAIDTPQFEGRSVDSPINSLFGVALATVLDTPVRVAATASDDESRTVTFRWSQTDDDP